MWWVGQAGRRNPAVGRSDYTTSNRPRLHTIDPVVIHVTQTAYAQILAVFQKGVIDVRLVESA
ncbi:hypothetical protein [Streptomyces canus]|uniref:hypothetical protein n=1 Tax=Streptomyces canus TaxID=58343 RepID=UPI003CED0F1D